MPIFTAFTTKPDYLKASFVIIFLSLYWSAALFAGKGIDTSTFNYDSLVQKITDNQCNYKTMSLHTALVWDDGNTEQPVKANIRMRRDSLVWLSITGAVGVEGARVLLTTDSFRMLSKMTGEYIVNDISYLRNWLLFPVSFKMLQQIISGEQILIDAQAKMVTWQDSMFVIYAETNKMLEKIWVNSGSYTIAKILLKDKMLSQSMTINFDSYNDLNGKPFSYKRELDITRDGVAMKLTMDITKVRMNDELSYPFEVTDKYKRVNEH